MRSAGLTIGVCLALWSAGCARHTRVALEVVQGDDAWGRIVIELADDKAPVTVANFLRYVDEGFYDGTIFHRANPEYVIQGGGYTAIGELKEEGLRGPIKLEQALRNMRGTIGMARDSAPDTADAQFFFNVIDNSPKLDFDGPRAPGYCAFGRVVEGLDVVDRIKNVRCVFNKDLPDPVPSQPVNPPIIRRAWRLGREAKE